MDDFLTPGERAIRRQVREHFQRGEGPRALEDVWIAGTAGLGRFFEDMGSPDPGLLGRALVIEEAATVSPRLGRALAASLPAASAAEAAARELAWSIGSAAAVLEAGLAAAREKGFFQSTLLGHHQVQGDLADAYSAVQALRLKAYRALRLIDRGERVRGESELMRAAAEVDSVRGRVLALAGALLGRGGLEVLMP